MSTNPFELAKQEAAKAPAKRQWAGWKGKLRFNSQELTGNIEFRYGKVATEALLDVEGQLEKVGPKGLPVTSKWEKHFYEGTDEISEDVIRFLQTQEDGTKLEVSPLERTDTIEVQEGRAMEECTIDGDLGLGTVIPREDVDKYAPESTYEIWGDDWGLLRLAEYLEKHRLALFFPYTFGRGFKIHEVTVYPIRYNGDLYLVMVMNSGQKRLKHAIKTLEAAPREERKVILVAPKLKARKPAGVS